MNLTARIEGHSVVVTAHSPIEKGVSREWKLSASHCLTFDESALVDAAWESREKAVQAEADKRALQMRENFESLRKLRDKTRKDNRQDWD